VKIFDDYDENKDLFGKDDFFEIIRKKDMQNARRKEDYLSQIFIGWQCPICWEIYNPHILNCVKEHKYGSNKRTNNTLPF